jgi:hypothetical protein
LLGLFPPPPPPGRADSEVCGEVLAQEAEVAWVAGQAELALAEANVVVDKLTAVGVREKEVVDCLGHDCGLGVFADGEVGDGRLLEVGDEGALGIEDRVPRVVGWGGNEERVGRRRATFGGFARVGVG